MVGATLLTAFILTSDHSYSAKQGAEGYGYGMIHYPVSILSSMHHKRVGSVVWGSI